MSVINARVKAGSPLVAPYRAAAIIYDVSKCAVEELKQLIPLSGVVQSSLVAPEAYGVMDDVLYIVTGR